MFKEKPFNKQEIKFLDAFLVRQKMYINGAIIISMNDSVE